MSIDSCTATPARPDTPPKLAPRYLFRWEESQAAYVLLYPEGIIKLNRSAGEILQRCDGQRSLAEIAADLAATFPDAGPALAENTAQFIALARDKGWLL